MNPNPIQIRIMAHPADIDYITAELRRVMDVIEESPDYQMRNRRRPTVRRYLVVELERRRPYGRRRIQCQLLC